IPRHVDARGVMVPEMDDKRLLPMLLIPLLDAVPSGPHLGLAHVTLAGDVGHIMRRGCPSHHFLKGLLLHPYLRAHRALFPEVQAEAPGCGLDNVGRIGPMRMGNNISSPIHDMIPVENAPHAALADSVPEFGV